MHYDDDYGDDVHQRVLLRQAICCSLYVVGRRWVGYGLGWVSYLERWVGFGSTKWTHGQHCFKHALSRCHPSCDELLYRLTRSFFEFIVERTRS